MVFSVNDQSYFSKLFWKYGHFLVVRNHIAGNECSFRASRTKKSQSQGTYWGLAKWQRSTEAENCRSGRIRYRSTCRFPKHLLRPELRLFGRSSGSTNSTESWEFGQSRFGRCFGRLMSPKLRPERAPVDLCKMVTISVFCHKAFNPRTN